MNTELDPRDFEGLPRSPFAAPTVGQGSPDGLAPPRPPRPHAPAGRRPRPPWLPWVVGVVLALAVVTGLVLRGDGSDTPEVVEQVDTTAEAPIADGEDPGVVAADDTAPPVQEEATGDVAAAPTGGAVGAEGFAARFAHGYLSYDEADPAARTADLARFLSPDLDPQLGWSGTGRQAAGLAFAVGSVVQPDGRTVVTTTVSVTGEGGPRWVHLDVPVARDGEGRWVVVGQPAFVPPPTLGAPTIDAAPPTDPAATADTRDDIEAFFAAFAEQQVVSVDGLTAPGVTIGGLGGDVALVAVRQVAVHEGDAGSRTATALVEWSNQVTGGQLEQSYLLHLVAGPDGWLVSAVEGG